MLENAPSSATLRNEMNELCSLGFLKQPHTSAGRVPTSSGYRIYINNLMNPVAIGESTKQYIDSIVSEFADPQNIVLSGASSLFELTGLPTIITRVIDDNAYLKRAQLLPLGRRSVMLLIVTSDGRTDSRICRIPYGISEDIYLRFTQLYEKRFKRMPLSRFQPAALQNIIAESGIHSLELVPVLTELFDMAQSAAESSVELVGDTGLYNICSEENVRRIKALAQRAEPLLSVLDARVKETQVIFGNDTNITELSSMAIVTAPYGRDDNPLGRIGVIGQSRMSYEQIIPSIEYIAERLSKLITQAQMDMED